MVLVGVPLRVVEACSRGRRKTVEQTERPENPLIYADSVWQEHCIAKVGRCTLLTAKTLRIDRGRDCSIIDYRIQDGRVETRIVDGATVGTENGWRPVSAEQLVSHVMRNTVIAHWLRRKMGIRWLLRACSQETPCTDNELNLAETASQACCSSASL